MQTLNPNPSDESSIFDSFTPGLNFCIRNEWRKKSMISQHKVRVISPGRIHFSLFDYLYMRPPLPGGGGIGISTDVFVNDITIEAGVNLVDNTHLPPAARHIFMLFKTLLNYDRDDILITVKDNIVYSHSGYGSNVTLNTSIFCGLNAMFNNPFTNQEIFSILTHNYIESTDANEIHWGFDTGVGEAALLFGGFVLIDEQCRFIGHVPVDHLYAVVAKGNMATLACEDYICRGLVENGETGAVEAQINEEVGMVHQRKHGKSLKNYLDTKLVPCFKSNDLKQLCQIVWQLNHLGTFKRMQMSYKKDVMLSFETVAKDHHAIYCGISSAGPSMFGLMTDLEDAQHFKQQIEKDFSSYFEFATIGQAGTRLRIQ